MNKTDQPDSHQVTKETVSWKYRLSKVQVSGIVVGPTVKGRTVMATRGIVSSDDQRFYTYMDSLGGLILSPLGLAQDYITHLICVIHEDESADLYTGDLGIEIEARPKSAFKKGQLLYLSDLVDVRRLRFVDIHIDPHDQIVAVIKVGWRFVMYFDFDRNTEHKIDRLETQLASKYSEALFYQFYSVAKSSKQLEKMMKDGWFPFIDLVPIRFNLLVNAYNGTNKRIAINELISHYDETELDRITSRWWEIPIFQSKKSILQSGINAFKQGNRDGYINSIKTLVSEIEGLIKLNLFNTPNVNKSWNIKQFIQYLTAKEVARSGGLNSMLIPDQFYKYLNEYVFADFLFDDTVSFSRNSVSHGAVSSRKYTKARALQIILTLDHLCFYLQSIDTDKVGNSVTTISK